MVNDFEARKGKGTERGYDPVSLRSLMNGALIVLMAPLLRLPTEGSVAEASGFGAGWR